MSHSMYTALSGAVAEERNLEVITDNLSNAITPGYKGARLNFNSLLVAQEGVQAENSPRVQVEIASSQNDWTQGNLKSTGNPLDLALRGPGFFVVQTPEGERLTRQGSFVHNSDGSLRTQSGMKVMGEQGPVHCRPDYPMSIDKTGAIYSGGIYVDNLKRVMAADQLQLQREGNSLWRVEDDSQLHLVGTSIEPGSLEMSNVNPVTAMTQLINTQRHYEMYHRAIENNRNLQQKATQELG